MGLVSFTRIRISDDAIPAMRARLRNFRTSGVVLCIEQDWFKKESVKSLFSDRLREVFMHEYSVLPQDVGSAATNISVRTLEGGGLRGGCVAVFRPDVWQLEDHREAVRRVHTYS